jgi:ubiquinone/menaquinone biosynthesis C-methylase UbiE
MTDSSDAQIWEKTYKSGDYLSLWDYEYPSQELVAAVALQWPKPDGTALDIGCGAGREAIFLAKCGFRVIAVDISTKALDIARRRASDAGVEVDWRQGSFFELPIEDEAVDFINDRGALHLVPEADRPRFAGEVNRVLKSGGSVFLRGAGLDAAEETFTPITAESIDTHFPSATFSRGPVLPITLVSDGGTLDARIVVLQKR